MGEEIGPLLLGVAIGIGIDLDHIFDTDSETDSDPDRTDNAGTLRLLLMSCRVMSWGVGMIMLHQVVRMARARGVRLFADFVPTDRNRMMFITYKFAGFREADKVGDLVIVEHDLEEIQPFPDSTKVELACE